MFHILLALIFIINTFDFRFWSLDGELICSIVPTMRSLSPLTAICCDQHADHVMAADASKMT